jgi:F0F1-type ATP synthase assembly protein I
MIRPIPEKISTAAGTLADTQVALLKNIWASQGQLQSQAAERNPWLFDGLQDIDSTTADAQAVSENMNLMRRAAQGQITEMRAEAKRLQASKIPGDAARGERLLAQADEAQKNLDQGFASAENHRKVAQAQQHQENQEAIDKPLLQSVLGGVLLGVSEIFLLAKRIAAGAWGLLIILVPLLVTAMGLWKLIQEVIGIFTFLATYAVTVVIGCAFGTVLLPVMLVSFLTQEWKKYGFAAVNWWLSVVVGTTTLSAGAVVAVAVLKALSGFLALAGAAIFNATVVSGATWTEKILGGLMSSPALFAIPVAVAMAVDILKKSPGIGVGFLNGTFQP